MFLLIIFLVSYGKTNQDPASFRLQQFVSYIKRNIFGGKMAREFRLFAASPGDVEEERGSLNEVVNEVNQTHGKPFNYRIELVKWETHVTTGAGRPQAVITEQIGDFDIFATSFWMPIGGSQIHILFILWRTIFSIGGWC